MSTSSMIGSNELNKDNVLDVKIKGDLITGNLVDGRKFETYTPYDPNLIDKLSKKDVKIDVSPTEKGSSFLSIILSWFPMLLLIGVWLFFMRQMNVSYTHLTMPTNREVYI